jgi:isopentenyldiphosphate isomerase
MERLVIVDENDEVIGTKNRSEREHDDIYRISALWVTNKVGDILLAQRSFDKKHDPGKWAAAVGGTVTEGETYDENIIRETKEEIGLTLKKPIKLSKMFIKANTGPYFVQWYGLIVANNVNLKRQEAEVEELGWFSKEDLKQLLEEMPEMFVDSSAEAWASFLK